MKITIKDEHGEGIPNIEFTNGDETLTTDSTGAVKFSGGKEFTRNENIAPPTEVAEVLINRLPNFIKI